MGARIRSRSAGVGRAVTREVRLLRQTRHPSREDAQAFSWSPVVLLLCFAGFYGLSSVALRMLGRNAAVPFSFLPFLGLVCLPLAIVVVCGLAVLPDRLRATSSGYRRQLLCIVAGLAVTYWFRIHGVWLLAALTLLVVTRSDWSVRRIGTAVTAMFGMALGYACVWNGNYLLAALVGNRLLDDKLLWIDLALFGVAGIGADNTPLFPLFTHPIVFRFMENSYAMLFPQVLVGLLLVSTTASVRVVTRWLSILFATYGIGLLVFAALPAVGPPIYEPGLFKPEFRNTFTAELMRLMADEYRQLQVGGTLSGFGYFVALPSLHVAVSVLVQASMRPWPWVFWTWAPVTVLLILSTVALGYHYLIDVPAGLALGFILVRALPAIGHAGVIHKPPPPGGYAG